MGLCITPHLPFNKHLDRVRERAARTADLAVHRPRLLRASRPNSRLRRSALRACLRLGRFELRLLLERPFAARQSVARKVHRCCRSRGFVATAAAQTAVGVAAVGGSDSGWGARRGVGWKDRHLQARAAPRFVSRAGAIGG